MVRLLAILVQDMAYQNDNNFSCGFICLCGTISYSVRMINILELLYQWGPNICV
jgi:hypothetical protein